MSQKRNAFREGLKDGLPICLGYLAVSFAFGIQAVSTGLSVFQSTLISLTNLTSAGQFAGLGIIAASGSFLEMAGVQFIINLPMLIFGFTIKTLFFSMKLMGLTYLRGLARGFVLCAKDIRNGHRNKVWFRPRYLGRYALIQYELLVNTIRRVAG